MRNLLFIFFFSTSFGQQITKVDFESMNATVYPNAIEKTISGEVKFEFKVLSLIDTISIDAINDS